MTEEYSSLCYWQRVFKFTIPEVFCILSGWKATLIPAVIKINNYVVKEFCESFSKENHALE